MRAAPPTAAEEAVAAPDLADALAASAAVALAFLAFARFGFDAHGALAAYVAAVLVILSAIDIERRVLPDRIVLPSTALVLLAQAALDPGRIVEFVVAAVGAAAFLLVPALLKPGALGMGDVKLALLLGAALGFAVPFGLLIGFVSAVPLGLALIAGKGLAARKASIPYGPFLAFGALVALFLGDAAPHLL